METDLLKNKIKGGIPSLLPENKGRRPDVSHAPKRKEILNTTEKKLAVKNALRYFDKKHHEVLAVEFLKELTDKCSCNRGHKDNPNLYP